MPKKSLFGAEGSMLDMPMGDPEATIIKASNGYIVRWSYGEKSIAKSFKEACKLVNNYFEEKTPDSEEE